VSYAGGIEELAGQGAIALVIAAQQFDPQRLSARTGRKVQFQSFAVPSIQRYLHGFIDRVQVHNVVPLASTRFKDADGREFQIQIADAKAVAPDVAAATAEENTHLHCALGKLRPRERHVIEETLLRGESLAETGRMLGLTRERIRQIQMAGIMKLRELLGE